jgi:hypothetical protein
VRGNSGGTNLPVLTLADLEVHDHDAPPARGTERRFLCPLPACEGHQNPRAGHRCFNLATDTGLWNCKRCGAHGQLKDHWQPLAPARNRTEVARRRFRQKMALPEPAPPAAASSPPDDLPPPPRREQAWRKPLKTRQPLRGTPGAAYLEKRGLPPDFCHAAGVRFVPDFFGRPAVVFAVQGAGGRLVAAQGRYIDGRDNPRMRTTGPRGEGVFATPGALDPGRALTVTEAPIDALTLALCGVPAIALCGCDGLPDWLRRAAAFRRVLAAFDADDAGEKAAGKLAAALHPVGAHVLRLRPEGAKDWNEQLRTVGADALTVHLRRLTWTPDQADTSDLTDPFADDVSDPDDSENGLYVGDDEAK